MLNESFKTEFHSCVHVDELYFPSETRTNY